MRKPAWILTILAVGCVSTNVEVTSNPDVVRGCKRLGTVEATTADRMFGAPKGSGWTRTLQSYAAEKGGDTLFLNAGGETGEAYLCRTPETTPAAK